MSGAWRGGAGRAGASRRRYTAEAGVPDGAQLSTPSPLKGCIPPASVPPPLQLKKQRRRRPADWRRLAVALQVKDAAATAPRKAAAATSLIRLLLPRPGPRVAPAPAHLGPRDVTPPARVRKQPPGAIHARPAAPRPPTRSPVRSRSERSSGGAHSAWSALSIGASAACGCRPGKSNQPITSFFLRIMAFYLPRRVFTNFSSLIVFTRNTMKRTTDVLYTSPGLRSHTVSPPAPRQRRRSEQLRGGHISPLRAPRASEATRPRGSPPRALRGHRRPCQLQGQEVASRRRGPTSERRNATRPREVLCECDCDGDFDEDQRTETRPAGDDVKSRRAHHLVTEGRPQM
ncbi:Protein of unknown function [Gryllus bimaculatus]|nr:Protein of unknown function [Gryllus bimaculatus]